MDNLIEQIGNFFSRRSNKETPESAPSKQGVTPSGYEVYSNAGYGGIESAKSRTYLEELKGWVASAITAIADEIATIQIKLYKVTDDGVEEVKEHPVLDLLYKVNAYTTKFDHFWLTQSYLELTGESPWFIERENGIPTNIYFLRPDKLQPIVGTTNIISGYRYAVSTNKTVDLGIDDIIFLKYPNPAKPFRGIGTLEMSARTVDIDNYSEEWNKQFYKNSAKPDGILYVKTDQMSKEQKDVLKKSIKDTYQGLEKAHKLMVLFGDMELKPSSLTQKDMDFLEQQRFSRDKILGMFRVPKAIVAQTEGVNYASADAAQYTFARWTIKPKMERLIQQLNEFLLPMFPDTESMYLDYDNPVPQDQTVQIARYSSGISSGWLTINEVREEQGLTPIDGADVVYLPFNLVPIGSSGSPVALPDGTQKIAIKVGRTNKKQGNPVRIAQMKARNKTYFKAVKIRKKIKEQIKSAIRHEMLNGGAHRVSNKTLDENDKPIRVLTDSEIKEFWATKNAIFNKYLVPMKDSSEKIFQEQRKQVLTNLYKESSKESFVPSKKASADELFKKIKLDKTTELKRTLQIQLPIIEQLYKESGDKSLQSLGLEEDFDVKREEVQKKLRSDIRKYSTTATDTTNSDIQKAVDNSITAGETLNELADRIKTLFDSAESYRADRIARTETLRYSTSATEQAFEDSGIVEGKMWVVNPTACELCLSMKDRQTGLGETFVNKGDSVNGTVLDYEDVNRPPLHPNCECDIVPIFKTAKSLGIEISNVKDINMTK